LVYEAVLVHNEAHYAAAAIHSGMRNQREALAHLSIDDIAMGTALGGGAFAGQDTEEVAMKWCGLSFGSTIAFGGSLCGELAQRAELLGIFGFPVK